MAKTRSKKRQQQLKAKQVRPQPHRPKTKQQPKAERVSSEKRRQTKQTSSKEEQRQTKQARSEKEQPLKTKRVCLHRSFRRSYREDYRRDLEVPGILHHLFSTFKIIFQNWRLFLPLLALAVVLNVVLVGLMSESTYTQFQDALNETSAQLASGEIGAVARAGLLLISSITTGGLAGGDSETGIVFTVLIFLVLWLVTIFLLRQRFAGRKVKLRDGLYNALTPLISTLVVFLLAVVQCIPIFILIIAYSAAVQTEFLSTPFYALVFFVFAALMILLSGYLLSSTLMALVAVSAPGLWPLKAVQASNDLMAGRRVRFVLRLVALLAALVVLWAGVMIPIIMLDLFLKEKIAWLSGVPVVPVCLNIMACFTMIYVTAYLYQYYRWMLDYEEK